MAYQPGKRAIEVNVYRAGAVGDSHVPVLVIHAEKEFPRDLSLEDSRRAHSDDGNKIADALMQCLAGGTLNQIMIRLLEHHRSELIVAAEPLLRMNT